MERQLKRENVENFGDGSEIRPLSPREILWRSFKRNKTAMIGLVVLVLLYGCSLFTQFLAPYGPDEMTPFKGVPPHRIRFITQEGHLSRPFVYAFKKKRDPETFRVIYTEDTTKRYPIRFFVSGKKRKLLGFIPIQTRLFGVEKGEAIFLLGTDPLGRDLFSRCLFGSQVSLSVSLVGTFITVVLGTTLGMVSGYFGRWLDMIIQRVIEVIISFPRLPLWIALAVLIPPEVPSFHTFLGISFVLAVIGWAGLARQVRGKVLSLREIDYVMAAKAVGASSSFILRRHLLLGCLNHVIVVATITVPTFILAESALSFLGIGITPPLISWGVLLKQAQNVRVFVYHIWLVTPGILIILTVLAFSFFGDGLRDAMDPYTR